MTFKWQTWSQWHLILKKRVNKTFVCTRLAPLFFFSISIQLGASTPLERCCVAYNWTCAAQQEVSLVQHIDPSSCLESLQAARKWFFSYLHFVLTCISLTQQVLIYRYTDLRTSCRFTLPRSLHDPNYTSDQIWLNHSRYYEMRDVDRMDYKNIFFIIVQMRQTCWHWGVRLPECLHHNNVTRMCFTSLTQSSVQKQTVFRAISKNLHF